MNDSLLITSKSNPKIKFIKELQKKKFRDEAGKFYIEGIRIVGDALFSDWSVDEIITAPDLLRSDFSRELVSRARAGKIPVIETSPEVFQSISAKDGPQGISAIVYKKVFELEELSRSGGTWIALESIQDPGNLGTIMRTIDAVGGKGLILLDHCVDPFSIESTRASMGSIFWIKTILASSQDLIDWLGRNQFHLIGSSDKAKVDFRQHKYDPGTILLMGSEQKGIGEALLAACEEVVSIPMRGKSDSLNLAVAAGIILYEVANQLK